jgi:hypothetical protein
MKFPVPFDTKVVFSTNLAPESLGDEAFFRRIQSKVLIPPIRDRQFETVLERVARERGVELTPDAPTHLRWMSRTLGDGDLRPYLPSAVINILESICLFEQRPLLLDPPMIERIADMYFTQAAEQSLVREMAQGGELEPPPPPPSSTQRSIPAASDAPAPAIASKKVRSIFAAPVEEEAPVQAARSDWATAAAKALAAESGDGDRDELPTLPTRGGGGPELTDEPDHEDGDGEDVEDGEGDDPGVPRFDYDRVIIS